METIDLGSFSMEDDAPAKIVTKQHVVAMPKTKALQKAIMDMCINKHMCKNKHICPLLLSTVFTLVLFSHQVRA
jgi:hypothetical protein